MAQNRELLLSVTEKDCKFIFSRGSGKGGQKRNKTSNACHCRHVASGAIGFADNTRSAATNKRMAFNRMTKTQEFNQWHVREMAKRLDICNPDDLSVEVGRL